MGNWNINIQGVGCHHNNRAEIDADQAFEKFVGDLQAQGHTIEHATFTHGGKETVESIAQKRKWREEDVAEKPAADG